MDGLELRDFYHTVGIGDVDLCWRMYGVGWRMGEGGMDEWLEGDVLRFEHASVQMGIEEEHDDLS